MRHVRPVFVVAALTLVGCGGNTAADRDAAAPPTVSSPASSGGVPTPTSPTTLDGGGGRSGAAAASIVPAVDVIDVSSGRSVGLRSAVATDKPTLIWMWAPH